MKAARHLAGHRGPKGAAPMPNKDVAKLPELIDERVKPNRLEEAEQMKTSLRRSEMQAFIAAMKLPEDWFDGLYESDRGEPATALGAVLRAVAEDVRGRHPELGEGRPGEGGENPPPAAEGGGGG